MWYVSPPLFIQVGSLEAILGLLPRKMSWNTNSCCWHLFDRVGAGRPAGNPRRRNAAGAPAVVIRQVSADSHPSVNHFQPQPQRPKTLDSLFASIRNAPQQAAPKFNAQLGGRRRGGGGGGRGRGQQTGGRMPYVWSGPLGQLLECFQNQHEQEGTWPIMFCCEDDWFMVTLLDAFSLIQENEF